MKMPNLEVEPAWGGRAVAIDGLFFVAAYIAATLLSAILGTAMRGWQAEAAGESPLLLQQGVAVAALLMARRPWWVPIVALQFGAEFAVGAWMTAPLQPDLALFHAVAAPGAAAAGAAVTALLLRPIVALGEGMSGVRRPLAFLVLGAGLGAGLGAFAKALVALATASAPWGFAFQWRADWIAQALGILAVVPLAVTGWGGSGGRERRREGAAGAAAENTPRERRSQRFDLLGRLAGSLAHDFNNQLTAILGHADLLSLETWDNENAMRSVEEIQRAAEKSATLTRRLVAFSRHRAPQLAPLDLGAQLQAMRELLERVLGNPVRVFIEKSTGPRPISADAYRLEQAVITLAICGHDAVPDGGRVLLATELGLLPPHLLPLAAAAEAGVEYVALRMEFDRAGAGEETEVRGERPPEPSMAGLSPEDIRQIAAGANALVDVDLSLGPPSSLTLYWPACEWQPEDLCREAREQQIGTGTETILLVEDQHEVRRLAEGALTQAGYRVVATGDGSEALRLLEQHGVEPDLLLTDVMMPEMSGIDLARAVGERWPGIRLLYMTSYVHSFEIPVAGLDGEVHLLGKPFKSIDLLLAIRRVLDAQG